MSLWDLEADIAAFCEFERRQIVFEHQQHVSRWIDDTPKVPADYSIRIGEIAYNLRSALDHLVWQLVLANGACPSTNNALPIYQDEEKYKKHATRKLKRVAPIHCDLIEEFQTYHGQRGVGAHLWMLDIICKGIIQIGSHEFQSSGHDIQPRPELPQGPPSAHSARC